MQKISRRFWRLFLGIALALFCSSAAAQAASKMIGTSYEGPGRKVDGTLYIVVEDPSVEMRVACRDLESRDQCEHRALSLFHKEISQP